MSGLTISFITLGFTILIGYSIAGLIWALPRIISKISPDESDK